jgi:putative tryptophan/tyrosine transport system substrate-binding protein
MQRREFITLVGGAAATWPLVARAQQPTMPVIGFLNSAAPEAFAPMVAAFRQGLGEAGYVEGRNVAIEYRWAGGQYDRLPALAADLVRRQAAVIVAGGGAVTARAARAATATIPIVFSMGDDPVKLGFVKNLNLPGGNLTGVSLLTTGLEAKRLEVLHEAVPGASVIGLLVNSNFPDVETQLKDVLTAARVLGLQITVLNASSERDIDTAFATLVQQRVGALLVASSPFFNGRREQLVALATRHAIPAIFEWPEFVALGGLMSYGTNLADAYRQVGIYTGKILKGDKPADLPVQQMVKVELFINLKTAKTLGLTFPLSLLGRADKVIE